MTAIRAADFVKSIGINTHIDFKLYGYENLANVIAAIKYLGVKHVRDSGCKDTDLVAWPQVATGAGIKFVTFMAEGSPADMQKALDLAPQLAALGVLEFIEGANEENNAYAVNLGNSVAKAVAFQQNVYDLGIAQSLPVIGPSFGSGWVAANNWRGNYDKVGDLSPLCDYANIHTYPRATAGQPSSDILRLNETGKLAAPSRRVVVTELGWDGRSMTDAAIAKFLLNSLMDVTLAGNPCTYLYALFDDAGKFGQLSP